MTHGRALLSAIEALPDWPINQARLPQVEFSLFYRSLFPFPVSSESQKPRNDLGPIAPPTAKAPIAACDFKIVEFRDDNHCRDWTAERYGFVTQFSAMLTHLARPSINGTPMTPAERRANLSEDELHISTEGGSTPVACR
jgi:hypothetical protein